MSLPCVEGTALMESKGNGSLSQVLLGSCKNKQNLEEGLDPSRKLANQVVLGQGSTATHRASDKTLALVC